MQLAIGVTDIMVIRRETAMSSWKGLDFNLAKVASFWSLLWRSTAHGSLALDAGVGFPNRGVENVDGSMARYGGIGIVGRARLGFLESNSFSASFDLSGRYLDLLNNANGSSGRESGNHIGLGAGLSLQFGKIVCCGEYSVMRARHFFVGPTRSEYVEFNLQHRSTTT